MSAIERTVLRLPRSAYLVAGFVALCSMAAVRSPWQSVIFLVPLFAAWVVARRATIVDENGLTARSVLGEQSVAWGELAGLRLDSSGAVYAVEVSRAELRLPCVRSTALGPLIAASGGRIPDPSAATDGRGTPERSDAQ